QKARFHAIPGHPQLSVASHVPLRLAYKNSGAAFWGGSRVKRAPGQSNLAYQAIVALKLSFSELSYSRESNFSSSAANPVSPSFTGFDDKSLNGSSEGNFFSNRSSV